MSKAIKKDNKDLDQILADIERQFGKGAVMCLGEDTHMKIDVVSSGCLSLDIALGVGGGNSGIEAAIDLAGICSKVTVLEFMDELKADQVLQEKAKSLPNVEIFVSSQTTEVVGNGDKVTGIRTKDRKTGEERVIHLDGIFVQIGLAANSGVFKEIVETNRPGEIVIDAHCRTNVPGIYAAGDVSTVPFKQIIISMGEGAKAALSAFEDRVRGVLG